MARVDTIHPNPIAHGQENYLALKQAIDEMISAEGEPFEDSLFIIQYVLDKAIIARGGMSVSDVTILVEIERSLHNQVNEYVDEQQ